MRLRVTHARSAAGNTYGVWVCLQYAHVLQNIVKTDEVTAQDESNGNRWRLGRELEPASRLEGGVNKWSKYWPWLVGHPRRPLFCC